MPYSISSILAKDGRLMNAVTATLVGALIGGLIGVFGSLITLFVPRYLSTRGDINLRTSRWELKPLEDNPAVYIYKLSIYMFNNMELNTAAQDIQLVLSKQGEHDPLVCTPTDVVDGYRLDSQVLPSRSAVNKDVGGEIDAAVLQEHFGDPFEETSVDEVGLKGFWPTGKPIMHKVSIQGVTNETPSSHRQWVGPWYSRLF
jgi:hypothetical protein